MTKLVLGRAAQRALMQPPGSPQHPVAISILPRTKYPKIKVNLSGVNGNAHAILGVVNKAMRDANVPSVERAMFQSEALARDYNHLLQTVVAWVTVA